MARPSGTFLGNAPWRIVARGHSVVVVSVAIATLALVAGAILFAQVGDQTAREADLQLEHHVAGKSAQIANLYDQAARDIRLARRNAVLEEVMAKPLSAVTPADRAAIDEALTYIGERYAVDETCLILANGTELGRWDHGHTAPLEDLSTEELVNNPGVAPTLKLADDSVYNVPKPYVSPDTGRWVTAFLTPVVLADGRAAGVLHFEIPIQRLANELLASRFGTSDFSLLMATDGTLLAHPDLAAFRTAAGLPVNPDDSPFPMITASGSSSWRIAADTARTSPRPGIVSFEQNGEGFRMEYRLVPGTSLIVATVVPTSELYAAVDRARLNLVLTVGPLIVLMVVLSAWFSGSMSRSNDRLGAANRALAEASQASAELAAIVQSADDAILSVDPTGRIATWNAAASQMLGMAGEDAIGSQLLRLLPTDRQAELPALLSAALDGEPVERFESVIQRGDGSTFNAWLTFSPVRGADGSVAGVAVIARDISDRKRLEDELAHQALHDALTGLPNRVLFQDRLRQSLHRDSRPKRRVTGRHGILFIDLDDFKVINDTLGHRIGDELLVAMARRLEESLRAGDTAARLGGDEFTVLLENVAGIEDAERAADRILDELRQPFELDGHQVVVSASIGIALGNPGVDNPDDLLRSADTALYEAKGRGKGRHATFQDNMNVRAWRRLELESEIRRAIANEELRVHYQPIVDLESGATVEVEALVRWEHPSRGLIMPSDFLPVAEQTGLISQVGAVVREAAIRDVAGARAATGSDVSLSVNVAPVELARGGFAETLGALLARHGLPPKRLTVEITESAMLEGESALDELRKLRALGVRVWIDDFGTGYSSLAYFRDMPVDGLKIDRMFVDGLGQRPEHTAIVTAALAFARALGLDVVGEGVETIDQRTRLHDLGCRLAQGYLFSKPVDATAMRAHLRSAEQPSDWAAHSA
jgi:diguanylate cyclase (GGDEF)-like protein/PAS domain S-box-containing protein